MKRRLMQRSPRLLSPAQRQARAAGGGGWGAAPRGRLHGYGSACAQHERHGRHRELAVRLPRSVSQPAAELILVETLHSHP